MARTLDELNECSRREFVAALGSLFEGSPWVADEAFGRRPFREAKQLHAELCSAMRGAPAARRLALIKAHPDLAGRLAAAGRLTAESAREQASAGLLELSAAETAEFERLNAAYRGRFGFPFVICARLNDRRSILSALRSRASGSPGEEEQAALAEIEKIAWLRLRDALQEA
jgi:2-oxo-4-hydroxy-4-carboxy-5-ureidoimidazoline decarboxylase